MAPDTEEDGPGSSKWAELPTEQRNPASAEIDRLGALDVLKVINSEDATVSAAVEQVLPEVALAVESVVKALSDGGRLVYVGAGTSGRLGVLDAAECPPTFGTDPGSVVGIIAGGDPALTRSQGGAEDLPEDGAQALRDLSVSRGDVVMGIASSGVTPYVLGALEEARDRGAATIFFTCNPEKAEQAPADIRITPAVGPEVVTGSTRLKAGTATKMVLNMVTTGAMIRLGKVYGNLMVDLVPTCDKLRDRSERILQELAGLDAREARDCLSLAGDLKTALVMTKRAVSRDTARRLLCESGGVVRIALGDDSA